MSQSIDEETREQIRMLVRKLFRAENPPGNKDAAAEVLATDYLPITRAKGQVDRDREETLKKVANASPSFHRDVDRANIDVALFLDHRVAVARSLLATTDSKDDPPTVASYRNMHVFLRRDDHWKCVAWQVTKVQEEDKPPLSELYEEISQNIRVTDETSFKLLGIVPIAAGVGSGALTILEKSKLLEDSYQGFAVLVLSVFGALMTFGLFQWELRNIQKCKWLISRAAKLERQLLLRNTFEPQFDGMASPEDLKASELKKIRLSSVLETPWGKTQAEKLIYCAAIGIWFVPMGIALHKIVQQFSGL